MADRTTNADGEGFAAGDLPALYRTADAQATAAERRFVALVQGEIVLPLLAVALTAVTPVATDSKWLGYAAAAALVVAAILHVIERTSGVEEIWLNARACAEEIKSLAWRYAMAVAPFDGDTADSTLLERLRSVAASFPQLVPPAEREQITAAMRRIHGASPAERAAIYTAGRVVDQQGWYRRKALALTTASDRWDIVFFVAAIATVVAGVIVPVTEWGAPIAGVGAAAAGSVLGWTGVRRLTANANRYRRMATNLALDEEIAPSAESTDQWTRYVLNVEERLGAERAGWLSARV